MKKILLTSTGFSNKKFAKLFLEQIDKPAKEIKAIFVPTAAINKGGKAMLPVCMKQLTDAGLLPDNIFSYDLDYLLSYEEGKLYDAIYFCGGDPAHLLSSINTAGFNHVLHRLVSEGMFYLGVSAGSIVAANNLQGNLGYVNCKLSVHCQNKSPNGTLNHGDTICLSDQQAIWITEGKTEIIE